MQSKEPNRERGSGRMTEPSQMDISGKRQGQQAGSMIACLLIILVLSLSTAVIEGMTFGYGAAILDVNDGSTDTNAIKASALEGNVVINGGPAGPQYSGLSGPWTNYAMVLYGGSNGLAVLANGEVNITNAAIVDIPPDSISKTNYAAGTPIPDFTYQGTTNALFQTARFVAVAQQTHVPTNINPNGNNEFTSLATFINALSTYATNAANALQGIVVVDVAYEDPNLGAFTTSRLPNGINVEGSLVFNFIGSGWTPTGIKIVIDTPMNINPANVSGLNPTNPATYTTGYPPVYLNPSNAPYNINITNVVDPLTGRKDFQNFSAGDDLPALLWTIGSVDLHNSLNICGAVYTPSYIEIENKGVGNLQYLRGQVICGYGMYYENHSYAVSVISYDANAVKRLATEVGNGAAASFISCYHQTNGTVVLSLRGVAGATYGIQASTDCVTWSNIGTSTIGPDGLGQFQDLNAVNFSNRFYRAAYP